MLMTLTHFVVKLRQHSFRLIKLASSRLNRGPNTEWELQHQLDQRSECSYQADNGELIHGLCGGFTRESCDDDCKCTFMDSTGTVNTTYGTVPIYCH